MKTNKKKADCWINLIPANLYPGEAAQWQPVHVSDELWINQATLAMAQTAQDDYKNKKL